MKKKTQIFDGKKYTYLTGATGINYYNTSLDIFIASSGECAIFYNKSDDFKLFESVDDNNFTFVRYKLFANRAECDDFIDKAQGCLTPMDGQFMVNLIDMLDCRYVF